MSELVIHMRDDVLTADGQLLGQAMVLYRRVEKETDNEDDLLFVADQENGLEYFIPTAAVDTARSADGKVYLSLSYSALQTESYTSQPQFIDAGDAEEVALAEEPNTVLKDERSD